MRRTAAPAISQDFRQTFPEVERLANSYLEFPLEQRPYSNEIPEDIVEIPEVGAILLAGFIDPSCTEEMVSDAEAQGLYILDEQKKTTATGAGHLEDDGTMRALFRQPHKQKYGLEPLRIPSTFVGKYSDECEILPPHTDDASSSIAAFTGLGRGGVLLDPSGKVDEGTFHKHMARDKIIRIEYGPQDLLIYDGNKFTHQGFRSDKIRYFITAFRQVF